MADIVTELKSTRLYRSLRLSFIFIVVLWIIQLLQAASGGSFGWLGIYPRQIFGLKGILLAPLIHGDWGHLLSNTPPLFVLTALILYFYRRIAFSSIAMIYLLTGAAVWLFGRPVFHIGASGVIYGMVAFVFWNGIFRRNFKSIALALIVVFYYGSMVMGILPGQEGISWESHLLGAVVGIFTSFWFRTSLEKDEERTPYSWETDPRAGEQHYFLDRDTFDKTKAQRRREQNQDGFSGWFSNHT